MIRSRILNVAEAKSRLSELIQRAARGEEIILARNGQAQARLVALAPKMARVPGKGTGKWTISSDFNDPLPAAILAGFDGSTE